MKRGAVALFVPHLGCPHRCSFCDQNAISGAESLPGKTDVERACETALSSGAVPENTEIAFFGGSFTAIPRDYMISLLEAASPYLKMGFKGIRVSTRPDCITPEILNILKDYGVISIELGAQSMDDRVLRLNARGHTSRDVEEASEFVKQYGFTLGLQMMIGLYGSTPELDRMTADKLIALRPSEARIYPTVILKNTVLGELYKSGKYIPFTLDEAVALCADLLERFENAGISVIKLGLHASENVEENMLGGLYHPAFRELCESLNFRKQMSALIGHDKSAAFTVPPKDLSKAIGQKKSNIEYFRRFGVRVTVTPDPMQHEKIKRTDGGAPCI